MISPREMVMKIRAAKDSRRDMLIIARRDARTVEGLEAAIDRAKQYLDAGADIIFPEALLNEEEFKKFAEEVDAPLLANMTEFGKTPYYTVEDFRRWGYEIVIFPATAFRACLKTMEFVYRELMDKGTQKHFLDKLMTRSEFYKLIKYDEYEKMDRELSRV